ncbi:MAG: PilZ domain-containing protein [Oleiharenicola lentus]
MPRVPIFTRILDFKRDFLARLRNKRSHPRHRVGAGFPLKASLNLVGEESYNAKRTPVRGTGLAWSGRVGDISANGLNLILPPAAATARGEPSVLKLTLENHALEIPCTVAHFRVHGSSHALCGIRLAFDDFKTQKAYLQLVEAVSMGASFAPAGPGRSQPGFVRRSWRSVNKALLTDWRDAGSRALDHFELTLGEHSVQGQSSRPGIEVHHRGNNAKSVSPAVEGEVRQLFRWVVGNLPKNVPADLREFMTRIGSSVPSAPPSAWGAPGGARPPIAPAGSAPPSAWEAPGPRSHA